jgi:hypothetical protein
VGTSLGYNRLVDDWEHSLVSWALAESYAVELMTSPKDEVRRIWTHSELMRHLMFFEWVWQSQYAQ